MVIKTLNSLALGTSGSNSPYIGKWAVVVVQATSYFFDVDIKIISSDHACFGDHLAQPSKLKAHTRSKVTLGFIAQNLYVSTRPICPFETASWVEVTSEGKILVNTYMPPRWPFDMDDVYAR